jgi:hypothetical protein
MSENLKYLKKEDLNKLDEFIQESLDKYYYVKAWDQLYNNTGKNHKDIISDKSTIPDLVIYNKGFNKLDCFYYPKVTKEKVKFPRKLFILKPKKLKQYDPSSAIININSKIQKEKKEEKKEEIFEFKSIPKEIENKYINKEEHNLLFDELKEFMKNDKDNPNETKVKLIHEKKNEAISGEIDNKEKVMQIQPNNKEKKGKKEIKKETNQNYEKNYKNKFGAPMQINNMNINFNNNFTMNNYLILQQKMIQNIQYQKYLNKILKNNPYNFNNNQENKFNSFVNRNEVINNRINNPQIINNNSNDNNYKGLNNDNESTKNNTLNTISYYKNTDGTNETEEFEKYINNIDEILKNYMNKRNWKVIDNRSNTAINKFNSEELYYFLSTVISTHENNNYSICDSEKDFYFNPLEIHEKLRNMFQKK